MSDENHKVEDYLITQLLKEKRKKNGAGDASILLTLWAVLFPLVLWVAPYLLQIPGWQVGLLWTFIGVLIVIVW